MERNGEHFNIYALIYVQLFVKCLYKFHHIETLKTNQKQVKQIDSTFYSYNHPLLSLLKEKPSIITSLENQKRKLTNSSSNCCKVP